MKIKIFFAFSVALLIVLIVAYRQKETSMTSNSEPAVAESSEEETAVAESSEEEIAAPESSEEETAEAESSEEETAEAAENETVTNEGNVATFTFASKDFEGKYVDETMFTGYELVIVYLWEPWSDSCIEDMKSLQKLSNKNKDILVVGVSDSPIKEVKDKLKQEGIKFPNIQYSSEFDAMNSTGYYPTAFFLDSNGCPVLKEKSQEAVMEAVKKEYRDDYETYKSGEYDNLKKDKKFMSYIKYIEPIADDDDSLETAIRQEYAECFGNEGEFSMTMSEEQWQMVTDILKEAK